MMDRLKKYIPIIILILLSSFLRFNNLGYSEFQDDEKKAFLRKGNNETTWQFFMDQRKGPMQFFITSATMVFNNDPTNELFIRFPFAVINIFGVVVFYLILRQLFNSKIVSFLGALLFSLNGFIVGFSRIAQYQNLNIMFSLLGLYFFILLSKKEDNQLKYSLLGTIFFSLSLLSHWDAVFFLIPIIYFYFKFISNNKIKKHTKIKTTLYSFLLGCVLLLPFLIPYTINQMSNTSNVEYFDRRVGVSNYSLKKHRSIFELYNPFIAIYFLPILAYLGLFKYKKSFLFIIWFGINFFMIKVFMEKPGTHIYNYIIPLIFLAAFGISLLKEHKKIFHAAFIPLIITITFLYYQSYMIFIDNTPEYPWYKKEILNYKKIILETDQYVDKEVLTFGFPHFRNWKKVNEIVSNDPDNCTYITNEGKEISQIYMNNKYGILENRKCYYIADVTRPFITRGNNVTFAKAYKKDPVYTYETDGYKLLHLYKIETK